MFATTMHEFGHMLGMVHEHQNPRGKSIQWDDAKVYEWAKATQGWSDQMTDINILDKYDVNSLNGSEFDPLSIMLYFFPASLTLNHVGTHQNLRLSGEDVLWISKMYPKDHGKSPENFYENVYNQDINESIKQSDRELSGHWE